jgi:hypothetical protein
MTATSLFTLLYRDQAPLVPRVLKRCANAELLGWLLESAALVCSGEYW